MNLIRAEDLALLVPELILVGTALLLILFSRWLRNGPQAALATLLAGLGALLVVGLPAGGQVQSGFLGMVVLDGYSRFFKCLIAAALALVTLLSARQQDAPARRRGEYHALLLLASSGMMFSISAVDLLTLYLGLELVTLSSYILVGISVERPAANEAAMKYFLLGSFVSALLLYGISLVYGITGTTDFAGVAAALAAQETGGRALLLAAVGLLVAGLAFKVAAVPFHAWAPDAYQGASAPVAAFLAGASKATGLAVLGRICLVAFPSEAPVLALFLMGFAGLSILAGSLIALVQTNLKRLLAYSSIAHAGYALLGLVSGTPEGVSATMLYSFLYVFMTLGAFGVVIALGEEGERLEAYQGLAASRPGTAALMLLFLLSLTGIPPTAGFAAKFAVILDVMRAGHVVLAVLAVVCSVISAFVYLRIAVLMYMREPASDPLAVCPAPVWAALGVAALVTLLGGIFPGSIAWWAVSP